MTARNYFNTQLFTDGPKPPCGKNCPDRAPGCSVTCEQWLDYVKERNENYKKRLKVKTANEPTDMGIKAAAKRSVRNSDYMKKRRK